MTESLRSVRTSVADARSSEACEGSWIGDIRAGDAAAFEAIFKKYYGPLASFAYRYVHSAEIAEELVQEVFLDFWAHRATIEIGEKVKTYLFVSVKNAAMSVLRHQRVERNGEAEMVNLFSGPRSTAESELYRAELTEAVHRAIARLPERCRIVVTLRREQGMSYAEIAELLGITPKTVENQLGKGFKALRRQLKAYWH